MEMEDKSFYRTEALTKRSEFYRGPLGIYELPSTYIIVLIGSALIAAVVFLVLGSYARKETVIGNIVADAGVSRMASQRPGQIRSILKDGDKVRTGQVVAVINSESFVGKGESTDSQVLAAQQNAAYYKAEDLKYQVLQFRQRMSGLMRRERESQAELSAVDAGLMLSDERIKLSQTTYEDLSKLASGQLVSKIDVRKQAQVVVDEKSRRLELLRQKIRLVQDIEQLKSEAVELRFQTRSIDARIGSADAEASESLLKGAQSAEHALVAQQTGTFYSRGKRVGDAVMSGEEVGAIVGDRSPLTVELKVPTKAVGMINQSSQVKVMIDAFPFERFGYVSANIHTISKTAFSGDPSQEPFFYIKARLNKNYVVAYGQRHFLTPGMTVKADLILERRTLMQWLLDPLRAKAIRL